MRKIMRFWGLGVLILVVGCTKLNSGVVGMFELDTDVRITFLVDEDVNPDEKHTPSPLYVRFYELQSDKAFRQADFLDLYERDETLLGKDLIAKQELNRLVPGKNREERFVVDPETRFIGLFAEFYQFKNAKYKVIVPVTQKNVIANALRVEISDNQMVLRSTR